MFKQGISETQRLNKRQLEGRLQQMRDKRDRLDEMRRDCSKRLRECNATELIRCREKEIDEFEKSCNEEEVEPPREPIIKLLKRKSTISLMISHFL